MDGNGDANQWAQIRNLRYKGEGSRRRTMPVKKKAAKKTAKKKAKK